MLKNNATILALAIVVGTATGACSKDPQIAKMEYLESGNKYFADQKYKEAIVEYRNAVQQDPRFGEARYKLAEAYLKENDPRNAYREYIRAADLLPEDIDAQKKAATMLLLGQQFEDAKNRADKALVLDPKDVEAQVLRGNALAGLKDLAGAVKDIEQAIRLDPGQATSYSNLGALQLAQGNPAEAEAAFKKAVETDPKSVPARLALANFYWSIGRRAEAESELKAALALDPKNELANRALATFYIGAGRAAEAEVYLKALAANASDPAVKLGLADYYMAMRRENDSLEVLDDVSKDPKSWGAARSRVAAIQYSRGQRDVGLKSIDEVLAKEPKNVQALLVKTRFLISEGKVDAALPIARTAMEADTSNAEAHYVLGMIYAAKSNVEEAIASMNEVLKLNPRATAAQIQLARLELSRGGSESSVQFAEQAVASAPTDPVARLTLARSLMASGDLPRAEKEMQALVSAFPKTAPVHSQYGLLQLLRKDTAGAKQSFDRAIALDANDLDGFRGLIAIDLGNKRLDDARVRMESRLAKTPKDPALLLLAARTYAAVGDAAKVEQTLRQVLDVDASRLEAYSMLGQLYLAQRKLDQAITEFQAIAQRQPKNVGAPTMVAMIFQMQGKQAEAQKVYEDVMQINPRAPPVAANNLAWMYAERGANLDVALQLAQVAKEQLPDTAEVDDTLGFVYLKRGLPSLAVPALQAASQRDPQNPSYRYRLGLAYSQVGNKEGARQELEQALKIRPDFPEAADARKVLAELGKS